MCEAGCVFCVRERERERERASERASERERERESVCVSVRLGICVCVVAFVRRGYKTSVLRGDVFVPVCMLEQVCTIVCSSKSVPAGISLNLNRTVLDPAIDYALNHMSRTPTQPHILNSN